MDEVSGAKHIRTSRVSNELLELWKGFPGIRAIVLHLRGKKGEHPHYHIWWEGTPQTGATLKNHLRAYNEVFNTYKQQNDWTVRSHNNFTTWANYVIDAGKGAMVLYETPDESHAPLPTVPVVASGGAGSPPVKVKVSSPGNRAPQRVRFVAYLKTKGWEEGCIKNWNMYEKLDELTEELTEWSENAFTTPNGAVVVQHALWVYGDEIVRNIIKQKNKDYLKKSFRLFSPELT